MAIDTEDKRRSAARWHPVMNVFPVPDGVISIFDRRHAAGRYRGLPVPVALSGGLTPSGALSRTLSLFRAYGGTLTPTGDLATVLSAFKSLGGGLTPSGDLATVLTLVVALGGTITPTGDFSLRNPAWLLLDKNLTWLGEWDAEYTYTTDDVILYKIPDGNEWHVFISKITHNLNNIPTSTASAWRRLYQEPLG